MAVKMGDGTTQKYHNTLTISNIFWVFGGGNGPPSNLLSLKCPAERSDFCPRLHIHLKHAGRKMDWKKLYQIHLQGCIAVRKRGRTQAWISLQNTHHRCTRTGPAVALGSCVDGLFRGCLFRFLSVIDDFSHECLAAVAGTSQSVFRVARELDRVTWMSGYQA